MRGSRPDGITIISSCEAAFAARDYDLESTLNSGQSFRWNKHGCGWAGVTAGRWVHLEYCADGIIAKTAVPQNDWSWLANYLQTQVNLHAIIATFPDDQTLQDSIRDCRGMRLLKQDPWECLASFILSSTKQIVQIRQIVALLCSRYGEPVRTPHGESVAFNFPTAERLAALTETELRACKMGFRAPNLLGTAKAVASGECNLTQLAQLTVEDARGELIKLPGVGEKIANCVLLYAYGFPTAFPLDVWVIRALERFYFRGHKIRLERLRAFSADHFGPYSGYAQQYLFHWIRTGGKKNIPNESKDR
jgi:N-glycosylase/DNA lyase